ncbi:MAG TPA: hypothetical protein VGL66_04930 [Caulobacteraceae bacterium]|jgi:hypothetical protein
MSRFSSGVLFAFGACWAGLCGTCTWNVLTAQPENPSIYVLSGIVGTAMTAFGLVIAAVGLRYMTARPK